MCRAKIGLNSTIENSPAIHRWDWQEPEMKSVKRTAEKSRNLAVIMQPSASRTTNPSALYPSSKLLGYYHSSALRTDKPTFCAKLSSISSRSTNAPGEAFEFMLSSSERRRTRLPIRRLVARARSTAA